MVEVHGYVESLKLEKPEVALFVWDCFVFFKALATDAA
jgi:hypothetical protein